MFQWFSNFSIFKNHLGNLLKRQTSGYNSQVRVHFNITMENSDLSCPLTTFYEKLTWSSVKPWSQGLHTPLNRKNWVERKIKKEKRKGWTVYVLLASPATAAIFLVCIHPSLTLGPWSLVALSATSGVIMWCKTKPISTPDSCCVPWLDLLWTAWTNQKKAQDPPPPQTYGKKWSVLCSAESFMDVRVLQTSSLFLATELKAIMAKFKAWSYCVSLEASRAWNCHLLQDFSVL